MDARILAIGIEAEGERIDSAPFEGEAPLDAYRAAAVDPSAAAALWSGLAPQAADAPDRRLAANRIIEAVRRRRREATELLRSGGSILCILRLLGPTLSIREPGQGGETVAVLHAYSWLPEDPALRRLVVAPVAGGEMSPRDSSHPAWRLIAAQGGRVRPVAAVACSELPAGWRAIATDAAGRLVAFEATIGAGSIAFVPPFAVEGPRERGALIERFFTAEQGPPAEPDWLGGIELPGQAELAARLATLSRQAEEVERELLDVRRRHARLVRLNALLSARTPAELAGPAAAALGLLGFRVETVDPAALWLEGPEGTALAVLAAATEAVDSDAYWELVHRMDDGPLRVAKGIILANGCCARPPAGRGEIFPDLLRRGALHRQVCLLDSVQLHRAAAALLERPDDTELRSKLRSLILETTGPCVLAEHLPSPQD